MNSLPLPAAIRSAAEPASATDPAPELAVGVRELVDFVLRRGDLRSEFTGSARAAEAVRLHQRLQASRPPGYLPELALSRIVKAPGFRLRITGRLDGVFAAEAVPRIEEIKTTRRPLRDCVREENPLHWGQAKIYAFLYASTHGLPEVEIQLTYVRVDTGKMREIRRRCDTGELAVFFEEVTGRYLAWASILRSWTSLRDRSIRNLPFPFPAFRPGQREMIAAVTRALEHGERIFIQAPTGIGKTLAVLYPALHALAANFLRRIFYLTARTTGRRTAEAALAALRERGLRLKHLSLTAREKICPRPGAACTPEECPFAEGHYDRLPAAREAFFEQDAWTRPALEAAAFEHRVCPFELSLDLVRWADLVAGDYNYAFDPQASLKRFFLEEGGDWAFLVDEAHNLAERSREMFSAQIRRRPYRELDRQLGRELPGVRRGLSALETWMREESRRIREAGGAKAEAAPPAELLASLREFTAAAERWLEKNRPAPYRRALLERYFEAAGFLKTAERSEETYAACSELLPHDLLLKLFCIDPSRPIGEALARCRAAVFFSATLSPGDYFRTLLAGETAASLVLPSPFPRENLGVFVADRISTVYRHRAATREAVARMLRVFVEGRPGHYLLFFPSYEYLLQVLEVFRCGAHGIEVLVQEPGMADSEREAFLARFEQGDGRTLAGFAVMGGVFGEGIDLAGPRLAGAAVVGVGLPAICLERELIRRHFTSRLGRGYEFAYRIPGIHRVLQAAGRVIRSESDRGVLLLLDRRYAEAETRRLLPEAWRPRPVRNEGELACELSRFWEAAPGPAAAPEN